MSNLIAHPQYKVIFWVSALVMIVLGVYMSNIRFMNIEWLSRAGCIVVMLGVWSSIGGIFQERILIKRINWRRRKAIARARAKHTEPKVDSEQTEKELIDINDIFDKELQQASLNLRLSIGVLEVSLLMTGTFLWGFGDIIVQ